MLSPLRDGQQSQIRTHPEEAQELITMAQEIVDLRWNSYEQMAGSEVRDFQPVPDVHGRNVN